jgi:hypothetical protein
MSTHHVLFLTSILLRVCRANTARIDITGNFTPPHLAYYDFPNPHSVVKGHELNENAIEIDGPFDGILGFAQGAALAVSYLLHHRIKSPQTPLPPPHLSLAYSSLASPINLPITTTSEKSSRISSKPWMQSR